MYMQIFAFCLEICEWDGLSLLWYESGFSNKIVLRHLFLWSYTNLMHPYADIHSYM